jgi:hypothetical protein
MGKKIRTDKNLDTSYSVSAETIGNNEDLIRQIFILLPVKLLIRFKVVSKHWSSLISDSQFARERTKRLNPNITPSGLFFYNFLSKSKEIEYVSLDESHSRVRVPSLSFLEIVASGAQIRILQSCNGLLLCRFTLETDKYCVCNPTTRNHKIIPQYCLKLGETVGGVALVFDPWVSPYYKVVCVFGNLDHGSRLEIYSSETDKWSSITSCSGKSCFDFGIY